MKIQCRACRYNLTVVRCMQVLCCVCVWICYCVVTRPCVGTSLEEGELYKLIVDRSQLNAQPEKLPKEAKTGMLCATVY